MKKTGIWIRVLALTMAAMLATGSSAVTGMAEEAMAVDIVESTVSEQLTESMSEKTEMTAEPVADTPDVPEGTEMLPVQSDIIIPEEPEPVLAQPDTDVIGVMESAPEQPSTDVSAETELSDMGELTIEDVQPMAQSPELIDVCSEDGTVPAARKIAGILQDGSDIEVTMRSKDDCRWYSFKPSESGTYIIYSESDEDNSPDPYTELYQEDSETCLDSCNDADSSYWGGADNLIGGSVCYCDFILRNNLLADTTYYYALRAYNEGTYKVHFRKVPELRDISIDSARTFVSKIDSAEDAVELLVTLMYENGIEEQFHCSSYDVVYEYDYDNDENVAVIYDPYGTEIRLNLPFLNDDNLNDIFPEPGSYTLSASVAGKEASTKLVFHSMQDVAHNHMIGEDGVILLEGSEDRLYAGYIPKSSGEYWILTGSSDGIYDVETQERLEYVENSARGYKYELTEGKIYLLCFYGGEIPVSGKVERSAKIESAEFNIKDEYAFSKIEEELRALQGSVVYAGGGKTEITGQWKAMCGIEKVGTIYYYELEGGECLYLSIDNGKWNVSLPCASESDTVLAVGTYTLRVVSNWNDIGMIGEKASSELLRRSITVTAPDDLEMTEMLMDGSASFSNRAGEEKWFTFHPEHTGIYRFELVSDDHDMDCTLYGSQYDWIQKWECSKQKTPLTYLLKEGETYYYKVRNKGEKEVAYELSLGEVQIKSLSAGMEFQPDTSDYDYEWFSYTAEEAAIYEMTARSKSDDYPSLWVTSYNAQWEVIDYGNLNDYLHYQKAGETFYFKIWDNNYGWDTDLNKYSVSLVKEPVQSLNLNQKVSGSDGQWFSFTPDKTDKYTFFTVDLEAEEEIYSYPECFDEKMDYIDRDTGCIESENQYGEQVYDEYCNLTLESGHTYLLHMEFPDYYNETFQVCISKVPEISSIAFNPEYWEQFLVIDEDNSVFYSDGELDITYENGENELFYHYLDGYEQKDRYENAILVELYGADVYGEPDYEKQIVFNEDVYGYVVKPGIYVLVAKTGRFDETGNFISNNVAPALRPIFVTDQEHYEHTFERITEKAATCKETGKTINRCKVCGYRDLASVQTIPVTGYTGGHATCKKGAVCENCGTEYTAPTSHTGGHATCKKGAVCENCGTEYTAPASHTGGHATCEKGAICVFCGKEYTASTGHNFANWETSAEATVFKAEQQVGTCTVCGKTTTRSYGEPAQKILKLNAGSLKMQTKQKTTKLEVTMGAGDSVASVSSSNVKVLKVTLKKGKIILRAQKKTGKSSVKITLASGLSKTVKVTVQKKKVTTKSIKNISKKIAIKKKQKITLRPMLRPFTSQDRIEYTSSNKKVVTVSSRGTVTAKRKGKAVITIKAGKKSVKCAITVK